jgi:hypothetical protein
MSDLTFKNRNGHTIITLPQSNKIQINDITSSDLSNLNFFSSNSFLEYTDDNIQDDIKNDDTATDDDSTTRSSNSSGPSTAMIEIGLAALGVIIGIPSCLVIYGCQRSREDEVNRRHYEVEMRRMNGGSGANF